MRLVLSFAFDEVSAASTGSQINPNVAQLSQTLRVRRFRHLAVAVPFVNATGVCANVQFDQLRFTQRQVPGGDYGELNGVADGTWYDLVPPGEPGRVMPTLFATWTLWTPPIPGGLVAAFDRVGGMVTSEYDCD